MSTRKGLGDRQHRHDPAYLRAKRENYAGRAIYKLEDIDKRYRLIRPGARILDLGCWPGSWLQYAQGRVGDEGSLVGIDLKEVEIALPPTVTTITGNVYKLRPAKLRDRFGPFDCTMSDMAPNTTGIRDSDTWKSEELFLRALEIGIAVMRPGGHFVAKVFQGGRFPELLSLVKEHFQLSHAYRSQHTRKSSREQYIIGQGLKKSYAGTLQHFCDTDPSEPDPSQSVPSQPEPSPSDINHSDPSPSDPSWPPA